MTDLEQVAHSQAFHWAESLFTKFVSHQLDLPAEWPGSLDQARMLVALAQKEQLDAGSTELLVDALQDRARFLWREFRSFRAA